MVELSLLGTLGLRDDGGRELPNVLVRQKQLALLAYLVVAEPQGWRQRNELLALFWPESDEKRARFSLRTALHGLRKDLGNDAILVRGDEQVMVNRDRLRCDVVEFEEHLAAGRLAQAMACYRGPLLNGVVVPGLADFHMWLDSRREGLRRKAVDTAMCLARAAETSRDFPEALRWARELETLAPHDESALRLQLSQLERLGDRVGAGQTFDRWAERLRTDLELEPSQETLALVERIRTSERVGRPPPAVPAPAPRPAAAATSRAVSTPTMPNEPGAVATARHSLVRRIAPWATAAAVVLGVFIILVAPKFRGPSAAAPVGTVVLPFQYAGDRDAAYMGGAMSLLMSASLGGTGPFGSIDPRAVAGAISRVGRSQGDLPLGSDVGRRLGARYFIAGTVVTAGKAMRVEAGLYEVSGAADPVARAVAEGETDSLFAVADRVARELLSRRIGAVAPDALGTTSIAALRAYLDGERALLGSRYADAADAFRRSVDADSLFARGWFRLGYAAGWANGGDTAVTALDRALVLSSRLSPQDRLLLLAWRAFLVGDKARAVDLYEHFLAAQPSNVEAWLELAELRYHWGPMLGIPPALAAQAFRRVVALAPEQASAFVHLARLEARENPGAPSLDTLTRAALSLGVEPGESLEMRALMAVRQRDTLSRRETIAAAAADPAAASQMVKLLLAGPADLAFVDAIAHAEESAPKLEQRVSAIVQRVQVAASRGRFIAAGALADSLGALNPGRSLEMRAWLVLIPLRSIDRAELRSLRRRLASFDTTLPVRRQMRGIGDPGIYAPRRLYLEGALALADGDTASARAIEDAILHRSGTDSLEHQFAVQYATTLGTERSLRLGGDAVRRAVESLPPNEVEVGNTFPDVMSFVNARSRWIRAELLEAAGEREQARRWWSTFPDPSAYDSWFLAGALVRRAALEANAGDRATARADYRRFLDLWRECDPTLRPLVTAAASRLAQLR